jgi:hypothetical protein
MRRVVACWLAVGGAAALAACAAPAARPVAPAATVVGTVVAIRPLAPESAMVTDARILAAVGTPADGPATPRPEMRAEIIVRVADGRTISVVQDGATPPRVGQRVTLTATASTRILPAAPGS